MHIKNKINASLFQDITYFVDQNKLMEQWWLLVQPILWQIQVWPS
jgi:hypothetical protein